MKTISIYFITLFLGLAALNPSPSFSSAPQSAEVTTGLEKAGQLNQAGDFKEALEILKELRRSHPEDNQILFDYLTTLTWLGRYQEVAPLSGRLIQLNPPDYALAAAAQSLRHSGWLRQAEIMYLEGQRRFPDQPDFIFGLVFTLADEKRLSEANHILNQYKAEPAPGTGEKILEVEAYITNQERQIKEAGLDSSRHEAAELARQGQYDEALARLTELKSRHPANEALVFDDLTILSWAGRHQESVAIIDSLDPSRFPPYVLEAAALSYRENGQLDKSENLYRLGLAQNPDDPKLLAGLQVTLNRQDGFEPERQAAQESRKAAPDASLAAKDGLPPAAPTAGPGFSERREEAVSLARSGDYTRSLARLTELSRERPDDQALLADRITVYSWAGQHARAADLSEQLDFMEAPEYAVVAATSSLRKSTRIKKAHARYEEALKRFPNNQDLNIGYAINWGEQGRSTKGLEHLDEYTRRHPDDNARPLSEARLYLRRKLTAKPAAAAPRPAYFGEQTKAVLLARDNQLDDSLEILERLYLGNPNDQAVLADYLTVLTYRGDYERVMELKPRLDVATAPAYAIESISETMIAGGDYHQARLYVENATKKQNRNPGLLITGALTLARSGEYIQAAAYLDEAGRTGGPGLATRLAATRLTVGYDRIRAMSDLERANQALAKDPTDRQALRLKVLSLSSVGASRLARELNQPSLNISEEQIKSLERASGRQEMNIDDFSEPVKNISQRYQTYHDALAYLERVRLEPDCAASAPCRAQTRLSRLGPLLQLNRLTELVDEYETLKEDQPHLPASAELAAAGAYLGLRQPEKAGQIYQALLDRHRAGRKLNHDDLHETQKGLFWSLLETERLPEALAQAQANYAERTPPNDLSPLSSHDWTAADSYMTMGLAYLYTGFLAQGEQLFQTSVAKAPNGLEMLSGLSLSQAMREQPRTAINTIRQARVLAPDNIGFMIQEANSLMAIGKWRQAHEIIKALEPLAPYSADIQNLSRSWETHNLFVARVSLGWSDATSKAANAYTPGQAPALEASLYSPPLKYNWRVYVGTALESGKFLEGSAHQEILIGGVEYRGPLVEASLEARNTHINNPGLPIKNDTNHFGGGLSGVVTPNDHWRFPFSLQLKSRNTPLRAIYNGLTADEYALGAAYHWNESRFLSASGSYMDFSDGNQRTALSGLFNQRILSRYNHTLDAQADLYTSHNTKNNDRPYFNPKDDFSYGLGLIYTGPIWRRYDKNLSHQLSAHAGGYQQKNYGSDPTWNIGYQQNLDWTDRFTTTYGVGYGRQVYDGDPEKNLNLHLAIVWRF